MFRCKGKHVRQVVYTLGEIGIGIEYGVIDVTNSQWSTTERQTIEEIYEIVDGALHLTFDYLAFTFVAAIIAAVGLITDSSVTVVASMLVSPLMGPILGISFGYFIADNNMMMKSMRNELYGMLLTFLVGMVCAGFSLVNMDITVSDMNEQMESRATYQGLIAGAVVAAPSGVGVALSVANTNINSLVGVAISAALLPPIVNSALLLVYGFHRSFIFDRYARRYYRGSAYSIGLFLMNWVLIFVFSMITFWIKGMHKSEISQPRWSGSAFANSQQHLSYYHESKVEEAIGMTNTMPTPPSSMSKTPQSATKKKKSMAEPLLS
ncbi:hypothetical protein AAMO2058_000330700 [Amorphochlora amoebiformis]